MVEQFCQKYFQSEECITILDLHNTHQCTSEDLMVYVKRLRDLALDCYDGHAESFLVEICINKMFSEYRAILENIEINQFARLLDVARKTTIFVKAISIRKFVAKSTEKKAIAHTLVVSVRAKDKWIANGAITLPQLLREPNNDDKRNPKCCVDFRDLNKACLKDEFSIPNMDVLTDNTIGCEMYCLMDGSNGYNQVSMCLSDVEKTAFCIPIDNFYYVVMPFGLKDAGALIKESWWLSFMISFTFILKSTLTTLW
ncbi:hypothetical protein SLEP1_g49440 [Rubroshorea leprosula]|uniref:Uncharacterized protein n=1 Tax=Rubroshorea leprosula TaxID=152421 RepID=A0AAV5LZV4_9ROSI|nr:hypothetical protein SLEP1_g49440 [Rubroshorea leprosula]